MKDTGLCQSRKPAGPRGTSCRLAVTAGSWPGPPVSRPPGWPTTATPTPPRHLAELRTGLSTGQHLTSPLSGRRPGNASPVSLSSLDPIRFPHDCELEAGGSRPAEGQTPPQGDHHRHLPEGQQTGPSSRLSPGSMNRKARPLRDSRGCSVFLGTPSARGDGTHDSLCPALGREHGHLHSRLQHQDELVNP